MATQPSYTNTAGEKAVGRMRLGVLMLRSPTRAWITDYQLTIHIVQLYSVSVDVLTSSMLTEYVPWAAGSAENAPMTLWLSADR